MHFVRCTCAPQAPRPRVPIAAHEQVPSCAPCVARRGASTRHTHPLPAATTSLAPWQVTAVAECAVQLSGFKNVDLFSQGVYQVRVRAYADRSGRAAVPFALTELPLPPLPGSVNSEQLLPAHLVGRERSCCPERRSSPPPDSHGWLWVAEARASASANERGALRVRAHHRRTSKTARATRGSSEPQ